MSNLCRLSLFALAVTAAQSLAASWVLASDAAGSRTVIGPPSSLLSDGAVALEAGRIEEGLRLTLEGLKDATSPEEYAAGHSNACAGYVLLKQWSEALAQCNAALALDASNWRIYNNRAAIYVEQGLLDLAQRDIEAGLAIAPGAPTLRESLRILQRNRKILGRQAKRAMPS